MTARIVAAFLAVTLVVLASLEIPLGANHARQAEDDLLVVIERDAFSLGDALEDLFETGTPSLATAATAAADEYERRTGGRVLIVDSAGVSVADTDPPAGAGDPVGRSFASRPEIAAALGGDTTVGSRRSDTVGDELVYAAVPVRSGSRVLGAVRISHSRDDLDRDIAGYRLRLVAIAAITLAAAAGVGVAVGRWATRPVRALQDRATAFGLGDLEARADTDTGPPEIRRLGAEFNQAADRLASALRTTSQFAADAAHQLRTPLTALRLRVDNLRGRARPPSDEELDRLDTELARMSRSIDVLLAMARLDERPPTRDPVPLVPLVRDVAATWGDAAADVGVDLVVRVDGPDAADDVPAVVDPEHLGQMVANLVANALAVSEPGASIELRVGPDPTPHVSVVDHGPGMDPESRRHATERHWNSRAGGTGLGLAIVDRLCAHNGAELHLDETAGGGLTATLQFGVQTPGLRGGQAAPDG